MNLALLGCDPDLLAVARAAVRQGHRLVWVHHTSPLDREVVVLAPHVRVAHEWEELLAEQEVDAVLVASGDEALRADQLRKLTQAGIPLLVAHPVVMSMLLYYELEMIRAEQKSLLVPCLVGRLHPAVARIAELTGEQSPGGIGQLEQVTIERSVVGPVRETVLHHFSHDIDLARALGGELNKVTATAASDEASRYANLSVQLSGTTGTLVRWSVEAVGAPGGRLTMRGTRGKATLEMPGPVFDGPTAWRLEIAATGETPRSEEFVPWDASTAALELLDRALAGQPVHPDWIDAARDIEITETIDRSLARGRTIELHFEDYSEEATFKGTMTSLGCGLLVAALAALIVAAIAAQAGVTWAGYYLYVLLGVLGLFLLLQLLKLVFPSRTDDALDENGAP